MDVPVNVHLGHCVKGIVPFGLKHEASAKNNVKKNVKSNRLETLKKNCDRAVNSAVRRDVLQGTTLD